MFPHKTLFTRLHTRAGLSVSRAKARTVACTLAISKAAETPFPDTSAMQIPRRFLLKRNTSKLISSHRLRRLPCGSHFKSRDLRDVGGQERLLNLTGALQFLILHLKLRGAAFHEEL